MGHRELFRVARLPVFQNKVFPDNTTALACPEGDVMLVQDMDTGLIFNVSFDAGLLAYDADYQNEQACSEVFWRHLEDVRLFIHHHFSRKFLIKVGCGKGYFLEHLRQSGYEIIGIDPAYEGDNPNVIKARFEASLRLSADGSYCATCWNILLIRLNSFQQLLMRMVEKEKSILRYLALTGFVGIVHGSTFLRTCELFPPY